MEHQASSHEEFVTVGSFTTVADLAMVEAELRERDIPYRMLDQNTVQVAPHYSAAIGGVRLQVRHRDRDAVVVILGDLGIEAERPHEGSELLDWFDGRTARLPCVGHMPLGQRFVMIAACCAILVALIWIAAGTPL